MTATGGGPGSAARCACGHTTGMNDIRTNGSRGACPVIAVRAVQRWKCKSPAVTGNG
jgi:hypothetical protein